MSVLTVAVLISICLKQLLLWSAIYMRPLTSSKTSCFGVKNKAVVPTPFRVPDAPVGEPANRVTAIVDNKATRILFDSEM